MGKITQGILGGFSGKVANVVGSSWKGIAVIKSLPLSVSNPRTAAQLAARSNFALTVALASLILSYFIKPFWDKWAVQMSGFNAFIKTNVNLISLIDNERYSNFIMSTGEMQETFAQEARFYANTQYFLMGWFSNILYKNQTQLDIAFVMVFADDLSNVLVSNGLIKRTDLSIELTGELNVVIGDKVNYVLAFASPDGSIVSDSTVHSIIVQ